MPKKKTPARALAVSTGPTTYPIANTTVAATQLFKVPDRHPGGDGPWNDEADKIGWIDERTGRQCIILRQANGTLSGYVAVEPAHPLFGYRHDAVPGVLGVSVHGGLTYAAPCEQNLMSRSLCATCHLRGCAVQGRMYSKTRTFGGSGSIPITPMILFQKCEAAAQIRSVTARSIAIRLTYTANASGWQRSCILTRLGSKFQSR